MATLKCTITKSSWYEMYIEYSYTQNAKTNKSVITHALKLKQLTDAYDFSGTMTVTYYVAGTAYSYNGVVDIDDKGNKGYTVTIKSGSTTVSHNSDGTKTIAFSCSGSCPSGGYGPGTITLNSTNVVLTKIDRTAPTVTFSSSNISSSSFKITATSTAKADLWEYSIDSGAWTQFSTTEGTSASVTITSKSPNTSYSVKVRARKSYNQVYGTSAAATIKTLGGAVVNSVQPVIADDTTVTITLNVTVYEASYTNAVVIKNGSTTILTITGLSWTKSTADRAITLTSSQRTTLLNAMSTIKSFTGTFEVKSYNGTTQVGTTSSKTATVTTTPSNSTPLITMFSYRDSREATAAITGNDQYFIQGYSWLTVTPGIAMPKNGATIASYSVKCDGMSGSNSTGDDITIGTIKTSGSVEALYTVTDSRGYSMSMSTRITILPYSPPKLNSLTLRRTNNVESEMQLIFNGSFSSIKINGVEKNELITASYEYKLTNTPTYGTRVSILSDVTGTGTSFSYENLELCDLDSDKSYDFHLLIRDKLNSLAPMDEYLVVTQGTPLVALRKNKVGINQPEPMGALDVIGDVYINGAQLDYVVSQGTSGIWTYRKWASGISECWGTYQASNINISSQNYDGYYYNKTAISINYPSGAFTAAPTAFADGGNTSHQHHIRVFQNSASAVSVTILCHSSSQTSVSMPIYLRALGKWK